MFRLINSRSNSGHYRSNWETLYYISDFEWEQNFAPTLSNLGAFRVNQGAFCPSAPLNFEPWSPIALVPQSNPVYPVVLIGSPSHWSPSVILVTQLSLDPHLIGPPPPCNLSYPAPIGPPSHWSPNVTLVIQFSLVPHLLGPPNVILVIRFSLVPHLIGPPCNLSYPALTGPPSHWSPNVILVIRFSLVPHLIGPPVLPRLPCSHWSPISLVAQCDPDYTVLIVPPSHWSPNATLITQFSLVPHPIGPPV